MISVSAWVFFPVWQRLSAPAERNALIGGGEPELTGKSSSCSINGPKGMDCKDGESRGWQWHQLFTFAPTSGLGNPTDLSSNEWSLSGSGTERTIHKLLPCINMGCILNPIWRPQLCGMPVQTRSREKKAVLFHAHTWQFWCQVLQAWMYYQRAIPIFPLAEVSRINLIVEIMKHRIIYQVND